MIDINEYRTMFAEKLKETTSFDDAFRKVIHRAYQAGIVDAYVESKFELVGKVTYDNWDKLFGDIEVDDDLFVKVKE